MKVLMTTEKVDNQDTIFAFSHLWIKTIAEQVDELVIIGLSVGSYDLPKNVKVYSLGKEKYDKQNKILKKLKYLFNFYKYIWKERKNYDFVFVHMNQQNVILGAPVWKFLGKKIGLWYTHRQVSKSLELAVKFADVVFTAAEESMNVPTNKKRVLGHGILTESFINPQRKNVLSEPKIIINSIGRITPIKDLGTLIRATKILNNKGYDVESIMIGPEVNEADKKYRRELDEIVKNEGIEEKIKFVGGKKPQETKDILWKSDIHVNLCPTGGLDKAVIESACSGVYSICANEAFRPHFEVEADNLIFKHGDAESLVRKIENILENKGKSELWRKKVEQRFLENFHVKALIKNLLGILEKC